VVNVGTETWLKFSVEKNLGKSVVELCDDDTGVAATVGLVTAGDVLEFKMKFAVVGTWLEFVTIMLAEACVVDSKLNLVVEKIVDEYALIIVVGKVVESVLIDVFVEDSDIEIWDEDIVLKSSLDVAVDDFGESRSKAVVLRF
jgi:hypothetical protein